eukprot:snap_masked-scaffold_14-processed-gene-2.42-mRNA-1 protein AED:1.00 eAED:1.00 QI:0/-1/0/0/-1/1/1/0/327
MKISDLLSEKGRLFIKNSPENILNISLPYPNRIISTPFTSEEELLSLVLSRMKDVQYINFELSSCDFTASENQEIFSIILFLFKQIALKCSISISFIGCTLSASLVNTLLHPLLTSPNAILHGFQTKFCTYNTLPDFSQLYTLLAKSSLLDSLNINSRIKSEPLVSKHLLKGNKRIQNLEISQNFSETEIIPFIFKSLKSFFFVRNLDIRLGKLTREQSLNLVCSLKSQDELINLTLGELYLCGAVLKVLLNYANETHTLKNLELPNMTYEFLDHPKLWRNIPVQSKTLESLRFSFESNHGTNQNGIHLTGVHRFTSVKIINLFVDP